MAKRQGTVAVGGSSGSHVEVLLAESVQGIGEQGEIVRVRPGHARNYLLPNGLATIATEQNKRMVGKHRERQLQVEADRVKSLKQRAEAVSKYSVTLEANATKEGHLYGSVVGNDISRALKSAGYEVEPDHVKLEGPLKELGMYTVKIELHPDVKTEVKVWVVPTAGA